MRRHGVRQADNLRAGRLFIWYHTTPSSDACQACVMNMSQGGCFKSSSALFDKVTCLAPLFHQKNQTLLPQVQQTNLPCVCAQAHPGCILRLLPQHPLLYLPMLLRPKRQDTAALLNRGCLLLLVY